MSLAIEALEYRRLMSATLSSTGRLEVEGLHHQANTIAVGLSTDANEIDVVINNGAVQQFDAANVNSLTIIGGEGNDTITIDQSHNPFSVPTHIFGGAGDDLITAGNEDDLIQGASGNDTIDSGNGNDTIRGGFGNDSLTCGNGNDILLGNAGNDSLVAGSGKDILSGGMGADSLTAGAGMDTLFGGAGHNTLDGGTGPALFIADHGSNQINGGSGNDSVQGADQHDQVNPGTGTMTMTQKQDPTLPVADARTPMKPAVVKNVGSLTGTVAENHGLYPGATIVLTPINPSRGSFNAADALSVLSDAHGVYTFTDVPSGNYFVFAENKAYGFGNRTVTIEAGKTKTLDMHLVFFGNLSRASRSIEGTISNEIGAAVAGATVMLVRESADDMGVPSPIHQGAEYVTTTDPAGNYSLLNVPAGLYLELAYDSTGAHGQAQFADQVTGTTLQNITLHTAAPVLANQSVVTITFKDSHGTPETGVNVEIEPYPFFFSTGLMENQVNQNPQGTFGSNEFFGTTDANGQVVFANFPAGLYSMTGYKAGYIDYNDTGETIKPGHMELNLRMPGPF